MSAEPLRLTHQSHTRWASCGDEQSARDGRLDHASQRARDDPDGPGGLCEPLDGRAFFGWLGCAPSQLGQHELGYKLGAPNLPAVWEEVDAFALIRALNSTRPVAPALMP